MRQLVHACAVAFFLLPMAVSRAEEAPPLDMDAAARAVTSALAAGDSDEALSIAAKAALRTNGSPAASALRAKVFASERRWADVDAVMREALARASDSDGQRHAYIEWTRVYWGEVFLDLPPRPVDYVRVATEATEAMPGDKKLLETLAYGAMNLLPFNDGGPPPAEDVELVRNWLSGLADRQPDVTWVHVTLGWLSTYCRYDHGTAVASLERAARLEPDSARSKRIFLDWGHAFLNQGDGVEAERILRLALGKKRTFGIDDGVIIADIALAQVMQGRFEKATASCGESLAWVKNHYGKDFEFDTAIYLANVLRLRADGKLDEMREAVRKFAEFEESERERARRELEALLLGALEPRASSRGYAFLITGGIVVVLLGALLAHRRRKVRARLRGSS